jgi:hypothetical protein
LPATPAAWSEIELHAASAIDGAQYERGAAAAARQEDPDVRGPLTRDYGFVLGRHAFGLEEAGDYVAAERARRVAIEPNPADSWAAHAVRRVFETTGRRHEGIAWTGRPDENSRECNHLRWGMSSVSVAATNSSCAASGNSFELTATMPRREGRCG